MAVAVDPSGRYAFAVNFWTEDITVFSVNESTGVLSEVSRSPFALPAGSRPTAVAAFRIAR